MGLRLALHSDDPDLIRPPVLAAFPKLRQQAIADAHLPAALPEKPEPTSTLDGRQHVGSIRQLLILGRALYRPPSGLPIRREILTPSGEFVSGISPRPAVSLRQNLKLPRVCTETAEALR